MIEKIADDLIGQMTEARLIDKEMEARYVYVFMIIPELSEPPVRTLGATIPENESHIFR